MRKEETTSDIDTEDSLSPEELLWRKAGRSEALTGVARITGALLSDDLGEFGVCSVAPEGVAGPTPPMGVDCTKGPKRMCVPVDPPLVPEREWEYSSTLWDALNWERAEFRQLMKHIYHYSFEWRLHDHGFETSRCELTVRVVGDIDGDGVLGRFERTINGYDAAGNWIEGSQENFVNEFE